MSYHLSVAERDEIMESLSPAQRDFLLNHIQRGKRTAFANVMARLKGITINEHESETFELIEQHLDGWILVQVIDSGFINPNTKCECGKALRYQYIVENKNTKEVLKFGINHFEQHVNLPNSVVKDVLKGFKQIDFELDELLMKIKKGVKSHNTVTTLQSALRETIPIPSNIKEQLELGLPLLEQQISMIASARQAILKRHSRVANERESEYRQLQLDKQTMKRNERQEKHQKAREERIVAWKAEIENNSAEADSVQPQTDPIEDVRELLVQKITPYVNQTTSIYEIAYLLIFHKERSLTAICNILIDYFGVSDSKFITGRPKIYADIFLALRQFVNTGELILLDSSNRHDCLYVVSDNPVPLEPQKKRKQVSVPASESTSETKPTTNRDANGRVVGEIEQLTLW